MKEPITLGVVSIKGGVGKTSVAANLAATLSRFGKRVLVIDANFTAPNLGFHVGLLNPKSTIHTVLLGKSKLFDAIYHHDAGFSVMPGSLNAEKINPLKLSEIIKPLKYYFNYIILDSSPALNDETYAVISASDELLVVTSPDYPTLSATLHAVKIAKKKNTLVRGLIINKSRGKNFELTKEDIENACGINVLSVLSDDVSLLKSLSRATPVTVDSPSGKLAKQYEKLAAALLGQDYEESKLSNFMSWFSETFSRFKR